MSQRSFCLVSSFCAKVSALVCGLFCRLWSPISFYFRIQRRWLKELISSGQHDKAWCGCSVCSRQSEIWVKKKIGASHWEGYWRCELHLSLKEYVPERLRACFWTDQPGRRVEGVGNQYLDPLSLFSQLRGRRIPPMAPSLQIPQMLQLYPSHSHGRNT